MASEAKDRGVPIRIGVNAGSLHPDIYANSEAPRPKRWSNGLDSNWRTSRRLTFTT